MDLINVAVSKSSKGRSQAGLLGDRPTPQIIGQLYFATDVGDNGQLYVAFGLTISDWLPIGAVQYTQNGDEVDMPANPEAAGHVYFAVDTMRFWIGIDNVTWVNIGKGYGVGAVRGMLTVTDDDGVLGSLIPGAAGEILTPDPTADEGIKWGTLGDVNYNPLVGGDWTPDPDNAQDAFDQLASRMTVVEAAVGGGGTLGGWRLRNSSNLAAPITQLSDVDVNWDTEDYDTNAFHDTGTDPNRCTIPSSMGGVYSISATLGFSLEDTFDGAIGAILKLFKNNSLQCLTTWEVPAFAIFVVQSLTLSTNIALADGDYVHIKYFVKGDNCGITFTGGYSYWSGERLR